MKFTDVELRILKRMSTINESMAFRKGSQIWTNTNPLKVFMSMNLETPIDTEFDVVNLAKFIQVISIMGDDYQIRTEDDDRNIYITDLANTAQVVKGDPIFTKIISKSIDIPTPDVSFDMDKETFSKIKRAIQIIEGKQIYLRNTGILIKDGERSEKSKFIIKKPLSSTEFEVPFEADVFSNLMDAGYKVTVQFRTSDRPALVKFEEIESSKFYYLLPESSIS